MRCALRHARGIEIGAVGGVQRHEAAAYLVSPGLRSDSAIDRPGAVAVCRVDRVRHNVGVTRVVIIGGGPGGYEAALVAAQLGAEVTVVDRDGIGGSAVLTDCVPSKTLIATAEVMTEVEGPGSSGSDSPGPLTVPGSRARRLPMRRPPSPWTWQR